MTVSGSFVGSETSTRATVKEVEKSGVVQGGTTKAGDLFESETNSGTSTGGAVTVAVGAMILLAASI